MSEGARRHRRRRSESCPDEGWPTGKKASFWDVLLHNAPISAMFIRQSRAQRQAIRRITALLLWVAALMLLPGAACWLYERSRFSDIAIAAAVSVLPWVGMFLSDYAPRRVRRNESFLSQVALMVVLWFFGGVCIFAVIQVFYHSIGFMAAVLALGFPAPMWYFFVEHIRILADHVLSLRTRNHYRR